MCYNHSMNLMTVTILFSFITLILIGSIIVLKKEINNFKYDISKIIVASKKIRYGDINIKIERLNNKELQDTINKLIETIYDRELMIKEYQTTWSKKNLSLQEIIKQEKELRHLKEDIVATLTHDMKVPVIAELNSIEYLLQGHFGELTEKQTQALNLMKASNEELKELIENILDAYKMEQQDTPLKLNNIELNSFIKNIIKEMEPISSKKSLNIHSNLTQTNDFIINIDEFQIKRVLKNLLQNAISFSSNSSKIEISTIKREKKIELNITNEGSPISEKDINLIFNKYYSGQSKYRKLSTGLGLYLSKKIATAHKGDLTVNCKNEKQTVFTLHLPI